MHWVAQESMAHYRTCQLNANSSSGEALKLYVAIRKPADVFLDKFQFLTLRATAS